MCNVVAAKYAALVERRARVKAEIAELVRQIQEIALHLEGMQEHCRASTWPLVLGESLGMKPAAASDEARKLRTMAKRSVLDKTFFVVNGMLPQPARKTPKAAKPNSSVLKVGNLSAEVMAARERGLNDQEREVIRGMLAKLVKDFG